MRVAHFRACITLPSTREINFIALANSLGGGIDTPGRCSLKIRQFSWADVDMQLGAVFATYYTEIGGSVARPS